MNVFEDLKSLNCGKVVVAPTLKDYTTFKVGGKALALIYPENVEGLKEVIQYARKNHIKYKVLGNGSNVIFKETGYDGLIIKLDHFDSLQIDGNNITVGAGYSLIKLALKTARLGLTGLEFASGIPATIGGAVFMNAGAYKSDMGYVVTSVTVLTPTLEIQELTNQQLNFHYRTSFLQQNPGYICLEAKLKLIYGKKELILEVIRDRKKED